MTAFLLLTMGLSFNKFAVLKVLPCFQNPASFTNETDREGIMRIGDSYRRIR
jgi:hypothetical protein